jgi:hypothetical protein
LDGDSSCSSNLLIKSLTELMLFKRFWSVLVWLRSIICSLAEWPVP